MFLSDSDMFKEEVAKKATFFFPDIHTEFSDNDEEEKNNVERYFRLYVGAMDGFNEQLTIIGQWELAVNSGMISADTKFSNIIILCQKKENISWLPQMTDLGQINKVCSNENKFYCNNDEHITVIEVPGLYTLDTSKTIALIPMACQWLYKDNVTKESWELTKRISKTFSQALSLDEKIRDIEDMLGLKEKYRSSVFSMVVEDFNKVCVVKYDDMIREQREAIASLMQQIQDRNSKIETMTWQVMKNKEYSKRGQEIADYMSKNNALVPLIGNTSGRPTFTYGVKTTLSNWEVERYDKVKSSVVRDTELRAPLSPLYKHNLVDDFWDSIFKKHIINISGVFEIDWNTRNIFAKRERVFNYNTVSDNCIANEHLARHACTGDYSYMIIDAINEGMWEQAIELTIASTANINPVEYGPTFSHFVDRIITNDWDKKFLVNPKTGELKSPKMVADEILAKE